MPANDPPTPPPPPADPPPPPPPPANPPAGDPPKLSHDEALAELARVRASEARYRTENTKLTAAQQAAERAKLTEEEQRQARIAELEKADGEKAAEIKRLKSQSAVYATAVRMGATKPELVHRLVADDLEYDETTGDPTNVDGVLTVFLKANPEFKGVAPAGGSGSADGGPRGNNSTLTREQIKKMTPDEVNARWEEVSAVLARGT